MVVFRGRCRKWGDPYLGAGDPTVVFVESGGGIEGALSKSGCEGKQQAVGVTFGLAATATLDAGDGGKEIARFRVISKEPEEALLLAGGAAVLVGVEVAEWGAGVGVGATPRHCEPPLLAADPPEPACR